MLRILRGLAVQAVRRAPRALQIRPRSRQDTAPLDTKGAVPKPKPVTEPELRGIIGNQSKGAGKTGNWINWKLTGQITGKLEPETDAWYQTTARQP